MKIIFIIITIIYFLSSFDLAYSFHFEIYNFLKKHLILWASMIAVILYTLSLDMLLGIIIIINFILTAVILEFILSICLDETYSLIVFLIPIVLLEILIITVILTIPFSYEEQVCKNEHVIELDDYKKGTNNKLVINLSEKDDNLKIYATMGYNSDNSIDIPDKLNKEDIEEFNISDSTDEKIIIVEEINQYDTILSYFKFLDYKETSTKTIYKLYLNSDRIKYKQK